MSAGVDIATLGLAIDATGAIKATTALDTLTATGARAEKQLAKVEGATRRLSTTADRAAQVARINAEQEAKWQANQQRLLQRRQETSSANWKASMERMAAANRTVEDSGRRAGIGLASMRGPLTTITTQLAHTNPAVGQLASMVGSFALGTGMMIAVLAGLAALAKAWELVTRRSREAAREQGDAIERARSVQGQLQLEDFGPGGQSAADLVAIEEKLAQMRPLIEALRNPARGRAFGPDAAQLRLMKDLFGEDKMSLLSTRSQQLEALLDKESEFIGLRRALQESVRRAEKEAGEAALREQEAAQKKAEQQLEEHLLRVQQMNAIAAAKVALAWVDASLAAQRRNAQARLPGALAGMDAPRMATTGPGLVGLPNIERTTTQQRMLAHTDMVRGLVGPDTSFLGALKSQALGLASAFGPVGLAAMALTPAFDALQPLLEGVSFGLTYLTQGLGWVIRAIGKLANWILPGNPANGLVLWGQAVIDNARAARRASDALNNLATDIPKVVNLALYRQRYGSGGGASAGLPERPSGFDPNQMQPRVGKFITGLPREGSPPLNFYGGIHIINEAGDTEEDLARKVVKGMERLSNQGVRLTIPGVSYAA